MSEIHLSDRQVEILRKIRSEANEMNAKLLDRAIAGTLSLDDIEMTCQLVNNEFLMRGIDENYNSNEYGRELENLLDMINRPRIV